MGPVVGAGEEGSRGVEVGMNSTADAVSDVSWLREVRVTSGVVRCRVLQVMSSRGRISRTRRIVLLIIAVPPYYWRTVKGMFILRALPD